MQQVVLYTRVSTDEQSLGYSLRDQKDKLEKYCELKNYRVIGHFEDDHSAKTFNRPEFQKFLSFVKKNKGIINRLVFTRWDRFSRNLTDALVMLRTLSELGIECDAMEQQLDLQVPENKLLLAVYLASPEIDNDRRSLNTTAGMRRALKEGRWCHCAPFGYRYTRDEKNKPLLIKDELKAALILEAFELRASGLYDKQTIRRMLAPKGMTLRKSPFNEIFNNILYMGRVPVKTYKNEPAQVIIGVHEAIVSDELFNKVQRIEKGIKPTDAKPVSAKDDFPLRGFLACPACGRNLTGSFSKSRNGRRFGYYHCQRPCKTRFRADNANNIFVDWLGRISLKPNRSETYLRLFAEVTKQQDGDRKRELQLVEQEIERIQALQLKSDRLFVEEKIDIASYQRLKDAYVSDLAVLHQKREMLQETTQEVINQLEFAISVMERLQNLWEELDMEGRRIMLGSIIPGKLIFENNEYRTTEDNPLLADIFSIEMEKASINEGLSGVVASTGIEPVSNV